MVIFYTTSITVLADKEKIQPTDTEMWIDLEWPADKEESVNAESRAVVGGPADSVGSTDADGLTSTEEFIIIYYKHQY